MNAGPGRTLVVTNDFPPRTGGIERFVWEVVRRLPAGSVVVHTSRPPAAQAASAAAVDADLAASGVVVVRDRARVLLPTPATSARVAATARTHGCDRAWIASAAPLGLMAARLRGAGVVRTVASTHGHEVWWASLPVSRSLLRAIAARNDVLTIVSEAAGSRIGAALPAERAAALVRLAPGVDAGSFTPHADGEAVRAAHGLSGRPVVVCVSRLVTRKGQDVLVAALPMVRAAVPGTALLLVGDGPRRRALVRAARRAALRTGFGGDVLLVGSIGVDDPALPAHYAAGDVFAMPSRDRRGGLETEALGMCYLEAAACGVPVVAGRSGGTGEALVDGTTGLLVDGRDTRAVAGAITGLLLERPRARAWGAAGRSWVSERWGWQERADQLEELLAPQPSGEWSPQPSGGWSPQPSGGWSPQPFGG